MHPFALYLAATDAERNDGTAAERNRRPQYATVDALPFFEPARASRLIRLTAGLRRRAELAARVLRHSRTRLSSVHGIEGSGES